MTFNIIANTIEYVVVALIVIYLIVGTKWLNT